MPRLSEVGDTAAVTNRYADKVIIYVEGADDVTIFYEISGQDVREYLEFRTPQETGSGARQVIDQVAKERPANSRVFGLLDGEAAALVGEIDALLCCAAVLFKAEREDLSGLIFLSHHEVENIFLLHGDLCELILKDVKIAKFGADTQETVDAEIRSVARRFFNAALIKYASLTLHHRAKADGGEVGCKVIDSARFLARAEPDEVLESIKQSIQAEGLVSWDEVKAEMCRTIRILAGWCRSQQLNREKMDQERLRLTDGKSVIDSLRRERSPSAKWEGHLLHAVRASGFGGLFRSQLMQLTNA